MGDLRLGPDHPSGCSLHHRPFHFVVWLETFSARNGLAFRSGRWLFDVLFCSRQVDLLWCADSDRLGNWTRRRSSTIKSAMAHCRPGRDRMDRRHSPGSREPQRRRGRNRAHKHALLPCTFPAYLGDSLLHFPAVSHLAITKDSLPFYLAVPPPVHHARPNGMKSRRRRVRAFSPEILFSCPIQTFPQPITPRPSPPQCGCTGWERHC